MVLNVQKICLIIAVFTAIPQISMARELYIHLTSSIVAVDGRMALSVENSNGNIKWHSFYGTIQGEGSTVNYWAPDIPTVDVVTALDDKGNYGSQTIIVQEKSEVEERSSIKNLYWELYTDRSVVQDIQLSDDKALLWVGTTGGLEKRSASNGELQLLYTNQNALLSNNVKTLLPDGKRGVWVGSDEGLVHISSNDTSTKFKVLNSGLPDNNVQAIASDGQGGIWVGTKGGTAHYLNDSWVLFKVSKVSEDRVNSLLPDGQGGIWVGTEDGLIHFFDHENWDIFNTSNSDLPSNYVYSLADAGKNGIWAGTERGFVLLQFDGGMHVLDMSNSDLPSNDIRSIEPDQGGIWLGTYEGITYYDANEYWLSLDTSNSDLPLNYINTLLSDGDGGIWVGTQGGGLSHRMSSGTWELFNESAFNLASNYVNTIHSDAQSEIWVGTVSGISQLRSDRKADTNGVLEVCTSSQISEAVSYDDQENFFNSGIEIRDAQSCPHCSVRWNVFSKSDTELPSDDVRSLLSDGQGGLWVGTEGGVAHIHADSETSWDVFDKTSSGIPSNSIRSLSSDNQGGLWIGTWGGGLAHLGYSSSIILNEQYLSGKRAAIIIAGGGNTDDNLLWYSTEKISNYIYEMLLERFFLNTDIHYISPMNYADFDGDGFDDHIVDAPLPQRQLTAQDIQDAFDWAKTKGELNQPLYIFFTDHGGDNRLQLAQGVYIEADQLNEMLDDYQNATSNKVIFVVDACHSGTLVESLAAPNRAIISSTDDSLAYFDTYDQQNFIYFMTKGLFKGMNFKEAFHFAESEQKKLLGKLSDYAVVAGDGTAAYSQKPQYDDTGDGTYTLSEEGEWLKEVMINGSITRADFTLAVSPVTISSTISALNQPMLKAEATLAAGKVTDVWAIIRPPQMDIIVDDTGIPILAFPRADMRLSQTEDNVWEGTWHGFDYNGEYEITFYAKDNEGNIESSDAITLTVTDGLECSSNAAVTVAVDKAVYAPGDAIRISVTEQLAYGYDLYVALLVPNGKIYTFTGKNRMEEMVNAWPAKWYQSNRDQGKEVVVLDDLAQLDDFPKGQYGVYAILAPERVDLLDTASNWVFDWVVFELE